MAIIKFVETDDVVKSTMSELVIFLLFFFLIYLGAISKIAQESENVHLEPAQQPAPPTQDNTTVDPLTIDLPKTLILSDNDGYRFEKGASTPSVDFIKVFNEEAINEIDETLDSFEDNIARIEVIGHTDEQPISRMSNLDERLIEFIDNDGGMVFNDDGTTFSIRLTSADNAGLGLARAATVTVMVSKHIKDTYPNVVVVPYSGGQLIENSDPLLLATGELDPRKEEPDRRRIEIRFVIK